MFRPAGALNLSGSRSTKIPLLTEPGFPPSVLKISPKLFRKRCRFGSYEQRTDQQMEDGTATLETVRKHSTRWEGIPAYATAVTTLDETVTSITDAARTQTARSGDAAAKGSAFQTMVNAAFTVCSALKALASATSDRKLSTEVDFSRTNLARGRETDVVNRCQTVLNLGTENAEALAAKYNVSAADLKAVKTAIAGFAELQPKPRQSKATSAAATRELETLFATLDEVLNNQIDPLTEKFRSSDASFYNEYQTARSIVTNATSRAGKDSTVTTVTIPKAA